jgi:hypothetical protein
LLLLAKSIALSFRQQKEEMMRTAKWILLFIPLTVMSGCSQDREERRETVKTILLAPIAAACWYLDHQPQTDPKDDIQRMVDQENAVGLPPGTGTHHLSGNHPDID